MQLDREEARLITEYYVCSGCWETLVNTFIDRTTSDVRCRTSKCECKGFVSKSFVKRNEAKQIEEKLEAREAIKNYFTWASKHKGKGAKKLLEELGF